MDIKKLIFYSIILLGMSNPPDMFSQDKNSKSKLEYENKWISENIRKNMRDLEKYGIKDEMIQYRLAFQDIDSTKLEEIKKETGLSLKEEYSNNNSLSLGYDFMSIFSEGVALGEFVDYSNKDQGCYPNYYKFKINEWLKKPKYLSNQDTITILNINIGGQRQPNIGDKNLIFLDNSHYYYYLNNTKRCDQEYKRDYFLMSMTSPIIFLDSALTIPKKLMGRINDGIPLNNKVLLEDLLKKEVLPITKFFKN